MKIYTSYWAIVRNFPKNLVGLNTTVWPPKYRPLGKDARGIIVQNCQPLIPGKECEYLCRGKCEPPHPQDCSFLQTYRKQLDRINFNEFYTYMGELGEKIANQEGLDNVNFAFIVFEPPTRACSERIPIQNWFRDNGVEIEEWHPNI